MTDSQGSSHQPTNQPTQAYHSRMESTASGNGGGYGCVDEDYNNNMYVGTRMSGVGGFVHTKRCSFAASLWFILHRKLSRSSCSLCRWPPRRYSVHAFQLLTGWILEMCTRVHISILKNRTHTSSHSNERHEQREY